MFTSKICLTVTVALLLGELTLAHTAVAETGFEGGLPFSNRFLEKKLRSRVDGSVTTGQKWNVYLTGRWARLAS